MVSNTGHRWGRMCRLVIGYSSQGPSPSQMIQAEWMRTQSHWAHPSVWDVRYSTGLTTHTSRSGYGDICDDKWPIRQGLWPHSPEAEQGRSCSRDFFMVASVRAGESSGLHLSFRVWSHHHYQSELNESYLQVSCPPSVLQTHHVMAYTMLF